MVTESREHPADTGDGERLRGPEALHHARERMDTAIVASAEDAMGWAGGLHDALDELADVLRRHRDASERPGGSLDEMERMEPRLSGRIEQSRAEHQPLIDRTEELRDTVAQQMEGGRVEVNHLRGIAGRLESDFRHHIAAGIELTYEAFERDMGGEG
ncbi:MAG: hypothetical protein F4Y97_00080 [Dehalococcoidia bacterium]|nr:hypothetical protein [Chloroflexota bacterium]MXY71416.1 hypothetical protein [Dehalococcoidia bacterium]